MEHRQLAADVMTLLGGLRPWDLATGEQTLEQAASAARAVDAGRAYDGGQLAPGVAAVVVAGAARVLSNPEESLTVVGSPFECRPGGFSAWTLAELAVLRQRRDVGVSAPGGEHEEQRSWGPETQGPADRAVAPVP